MTSTNSNTGGQSSSSFRPSSHLEALQFVGAGEGKGEIPARHPDEDRVGGDGQGVDRREIYRLDAGGTALVRTYPTATQRYRRC